MVVDFRKSSKWWLLSVSSHGWQVQVFGTEIETVCFAPSSHLTGILSSSYCDTEQHWHFFSCFIVYRLYFVPELHAPWHSVNPRMGWIFLHFPCWSRLISTKPRVCESLNETGRHSSEKEIEIESWIYCKYYVSHFIDLLLSSGGVLHIVQQFSKYWNCFGQWLTSGHVGLDIDKIGCSPDKEHLYSVQLSFPYHVDPTSNVLPSSTHLSCKHCPQHLPFPTFNDSPSGHFLIKHCSILSVIIAVPSAL